MPHNTPVTFCPAVTLHVNRVLVFLFFNLPTQQLTGKTNIIVGGKKRETDNRSVRKTIRILRFPFFKSQRLFFALVFFVLLVFTRLNDYWLVLRTVRPVVCPSCSTKTHAYVFIAVLLAGTRGMVCVCCFRARIRSVAHLQPNTPNAVLTADDVFEQRNKIQSLSHPLFVSGKPHVV